MEGHEQKTTEKTVVFITLSYFPALGGAEKQAQFLAERWAKSGQKVVVLTRSQPKVPSRELINGVQVVRFPVIWLPGVAWLTFGTPCFLYLASKRRSIAGVISLMLNASTLPGACAARCFGIPLIVKPSAGGPDGNIQRLARSFLSFLKVPFLLRAVSYFIAINEEIRQDLLVLKVPEYKIRSIPNGVDAAYFQVSKRHPVGSNSVLFAGRLEKVKNLDTLLNAWQKVVEQIPQASLSLAGDGPERRRLEELCQSLAIQDSVHWLGPQADLRSRYAAADLFVLPSFREGVSNALLEAMACGSVPVASAVGGNRDVLSPWNEKLLLDPNDTAAWSARMVELLKDRTMRSALSEEMRKRILEHYALDTVDHAYRQLLEASSSPLFRKPFPILAYHRVVPQVKYGIDVSRDMFEKQMAWLARKGYHSLNMEKFYQSLSSRTLDPKGIIITFDDGHQDFVQHAVPILKKYGYSATLFVNSGLLGRTFWVGGRRPAPVRWHDTKPADYREDSSDWRVYEFMSWDEVVLLRKEGFDIQSHGITHPFLTDLPRPEVRREMSESKKILQEKAGSPVKYFCYPSGNFNADVQKDAKESGYDAAVQSPGHDHLHYYWDDLFALERIGVWSDVQFWKFKKLVTGEYVRLLQCTPRWVWASARWIYRLGRST